MRKRADRVAVLLPCAACGRPAEGNYGIHRDGFCEGPEVALCDGCGSRPEPSLEEIWRLIAERAGRGERMVPVKERRAEKKREARRPPRGRR